MQFPEYQRVIYGKNPLSEVIFQVRFPRILSLEVKVPADFQVELNGRYPIVETREGVALNIPIQGESLRSAVPRTIYDFSDGSKNIKVSLGSDFLAVSTTDYERWEYFEHHIEHAMNALTKVYGTQVYTRLGLRYIDFLDRSKIGLSGIPWAQLINLDILGMMGTSLVGEDEVLESQSFIVVKVIGGSLASRTGVTKAPNGELAFIVDNDFFVEEVLEGKSNALDRLRGFHTEAGRAFRWCIQDRLHEALGPSGVS